MPTINKLFLLKLALVTLALTGVLVGVHTVQARRIPDALRHQADRAADNSKTDLAVHYLRQYLEFRPTDTDAQERLATLMKEKPGRNPSELLLLYDKILRNDPTRSAVRRDALTACLRMGRYTDAEDHANVLLKEFPTDPDLWQKLAVAQAGLQNTEEARKSYEAAIGLDPSDPVPYQRLAQYLWGDLKLAPDSKAVIDRLVAALPLDAESYLTRARFDLFAADGSNALPDLRRALELDPENADALLLLAEQLQKGRDLAGARDCLADGLRLYPSDARMVRSLAWLELNRGNIGAAVGVLEDGMNHVRDSFDLLVPLADLLVQLGETARTEEIVRKLEGRSTAEARMQTKYLKSRLAMRRADWNGAAEILVALRAEAANLPGLENQTNLLLSICYQKQGDPAREQDTLKLLLNKDPNHVAARVALALSYLNSGRAAEAIREYEVAVQSPYASPTTHAALLRLKARDLKINGGRPRDWQQLDRAAGDLTKVYHPSAADPVLIRADLFAARGEYLKAATVLRAEAARRPGDTRLWAALAEATANVAGTGAGLGVVDEAQAAAGDGPEVRLARAALYARDPAALYPFDPLGGQIEMWPDADQTRFLFGMIEIYDRLGDDARVIQTYKRLVARRPADLNVWEALGERATASGDATTAAAARTAVAKLDPTGKAAALMDAWTVATAKNPAAAGAAADALVKAYGANPERAEACVALGKLKALGGDAAEAGKMFERATRLDPVRFPPVQAELAYLVSTGADAATAAVLARLAVDYRWAGEPFRRAVRGAARQLPSAGAKTLLAAARQYLETEPGGLGWLGDVYRAAGFKPEAVACYERAVGTAVANADDYLRLAVRTAEAGNVEGAVEGMAAARKKLPAPQFFAVAAEFAETKAAPVNWFPETESPADQKLYAQARLALKLSCLKRAEAVDMLEAFVKTVPAGSPTASWGTRNLAMLLAVRGGALDHKRAMDLLAKGGDQAGETPDEKRSAAAVLTALSRHLEGPDRKAALARAVKALDELVAETRSPRDAFLLAQVYRAAGNRAASIKVLNELNTSDPKNLDFHLMALDLLTEEENLRAAEPFARRLMVLYPTDVRAITAVARFECKSGHPERALVMAEEYPRTADANAGDLPTKSARTAELLDELSRLPNVRRTEIGHKMVRSAVEKYEGLIAERPEAVVAAAGLLASDERYGDAFTLIEKHSAILPSRLKAAAGLAALRAGGASERQIARAQEWFATARAEDPDSIALRLNEGEFFAIKQDFPHAEEAYRAVLDRDPKNVVALNNLAWLLAPRPEAAAQALALVDRAVGEVGVTGELLDTRARVRIAAKQYEMAEKDLVEALAQEKTPLRMFHLALAKEGQTPSRKSEAREAFRKAKDRGLDPRSVHPADLPQYRLFDAERPQKSVPN
ncbi:tetratricopeptide repeat protein [Fimbriiglobus ruber]|uniref:TPR domain protein, putative component of TonB system n=1 Tax=Fimbriiglobus ruber TaxID=1908690 RepID=A0A225DFF7_9BACT|nr:tetratricopeptide repeat protein [Fimbriiglobus ruber]OWK39713.1 TPR domain protein, putative component of TonB system [Fimbriiglobus ruber]